MKKFQVEMLANATVKGHIQVEANSKEEAKEKVRQMILDSDDDICDIEWEYDFLSENNPNYRVLP